jgi:ubiquinone/menaquinone biosynthesis C-methylase UbiE
VRLFSKPKYQPAKSAYDLWAKHYDEQPHNLMLAWDEEIFSGILNTLDIQNKIVADIGCGTGRHWQKIFDKNPAKVIGFDVSEGMLQQLNQKFIGAETHVLAGIELKGLSDASCDCVISTLTIAHIEDARQAISEWSRVLKPGGYLVITDYHPTALAKGAKRTFTHNEKTIAIKNYVHEIAGIKNRAGQLHLQLLRLVEKRIDESAKPFYEAQNALRLYDAWKGTPVIYGMLLKKNNEAV